MFCIEEVLWGWFFWGNGYGRRRAAVSIYYVLVSAILKGCWAEGYVGYVKEILG